jgi:hypothetical protein
VYVAGVVPRLKQVAVGSAQAVLLLMQAAPQYEPTVSWMQVPPAPQVVLSVQGLQTGATWPPVEPVVPVEPVLVGWLAQVPPLSA